MKKYLLLLVCCVGCTSSPLAPTVSQQSPAAPVLVTAPVPPSADKPVFYQGYAIISKFDCTTHTFHRVGNDSIPAQIRAGVTGNEVRATVSVNDETRPYDVFLFSTGGYYLGNDSTSYAYFSKDYNSITWGAPLENDPTQYKTIYASR